MKLQEKLDAYKRGFLKQVPEDALKIMHRATDDLQHSGIMDTAVKVGDQADLTLESLPASL